MIRFDHVTKQLGGRNVLDDLTFDIKKGEIFAIVGPSGTGKSVTLKHMVRLLTPTRGAVWIDGVEVSAANGDELARVRERFGYLFQGGALLGWMTVEENIALPLREKTRLSEAEIEARVAMPDALLVDLLPKRGRQLCTTLEWLANIALFGLLTWFGWCMAFDDFEFEVTSPGLGLPQWCYTIWLPLLCALIVLRLVLLVASRRTKKP